MTLFQRVKEHEDLTGKKGGTSSPSELLGRGGKQKPHPGGHQWPWWEGVGSATLRTSVEVLQISGLCSR